MMIAEVCSLFVAAIFMQAAVHSLRRWTDYAAIVENYRLLPPTWARMAAYVLPSAQIVAAVLLLVPMTREAGIVLSVLLMAVFTGAVLVNFRRGRTHIDCGCGGASGQKLSGGLVIRNLLICGMLIVAGMAPTTEHWSAASATGVAGAATFVIALYFAANQLMANAQAFGMSSGRQA